MRAYLNLRYAVLERRAAFVAGLEALGFDVVNGFPLDKPSLGDAFVTWNRLGQAHTVAQQFERLGLPVIVAENAGWGNEFNGSHWYTLARNFHNTAECFPIGDASRWDSLGVELAPWRTKGETVILPQRGIGPMGVAMPMGWTDRAVAKYGGRVRRHPGQNVATPLEADLAHCGRAVTWGSGAAIKALMMGIPVVSEMPRWIGKCENTDASRLEMFRRLAWAQWTIDEIATGEPFARLIN